MTPHLASALLPALRRLDPERAHLLGLAALRWGLAGRGPAPDPVLATEALGLRFATPLGLAAGFDKNATAVGALRALGFGYVEVGTVTPLPQDGNPRPRMFRLPQDRAVINRMGFNGQGAERVAARLEAAPRPLGVNIGINKQGADPLRDYPALVRRFAALADYIVINVSSPNTPGLRDLQGEAALAEILAAMPAARPPLLVKLAPDLGEAALGPIVEACADGGVAGLVISNTTLARTGLRSRQAGQVGGLSGAPLFATSTAMLARVHRLARGRLCLIGVGGIRTGAQALAKIKAGASLVQAYTEFAYAGPGWVGQLNRQLAAALRAEGYRQVADAVGVEAA